MDIRPEYLSDYQAQMKNVYFAETGERAIFLNRPSVMLGLIPIRDGNQWCVLYGENLQVGIAGFGDSPDKAMENFDMDWIKDIPNKEA